MKQIIYEYIGKAKDFKIENFVVKGNLINKEDKDNDEK